MMEKLEINNANNSHDNTWQCWMVNTRTREEQLIAHGYRLEEDCIRDTTNIFEKWEIDLYPTSEGWTVVYRQDTPLKMAQYWRDYYQELAKFWSQRYEEILLSHKQYSQQLPHIEQQPLDVTQPKKLIRRKRVKIGASKVVGHRYKRSLDAVPWIGRLLAGTLLWAIAFEVIGFVTQPPKDELFIAQHTTDIPLSIRELFSSKKAPGSIAIGVAEGNLTPSGKPTAIYSKGHTDPGNFATNRGFCSWNKAEAISLKEADKLCLEALQQHSVAIENQLVYLGLNPQSHKVAIIMGTDLWNQSNFAGSNFPAKYKAAQEKGLKAQQAYIWARVEAFRNEQQQLDASGLFGICKREPFYQQQLIGLEVDSEAWRWNCIKLDQKRRILVVEKVLKSNSFS